MKLEGKTLKEEKKEKIIIIIITLLYVKGKYCYFHLIRDLTYEYRGILKCEDLLNFQQNKSSSSFCCQSSLLTDARSSSKAREF